MLPTHAVGIDLGTTYSCIAYLNEHGEPVTIPNHDGELSTPSVVMFDHDQVIVGTEALRNSIRSPDRVVMHAKRYMGDPQHRFQVGGRSYSPTDISTYILKQLLSDARERIGAIERAVITVPAQFSDRQRQATIDAGKRAGLKHVDVINEPVAAALCFVLGKEGIWFTELATAQTIMVVDLGGGTFDLSLVKYEQNSVRVIASGGDLNLGGLDWNAALERSIAKQFQKEFQVDPLKDRESRQALSMEIEQVKRSLSVRPKAALTCAHAGHRKTYQIEVEQFERIAKPLVDRTQDLTRALLKDNKMGWAHVDVVLTTGGSSRMPMIRSMLKSLSGRTLNSSLSPDQSIAHGATYYAGMLLTNNAFAKSILSETAAARLRQFKQQSANARALGILVRDMESKQRVPHYLIPANTQLPTEAKQTVGTVVANQKRAHLYVVESGTAADSQFVELGACLVEPLPADLPEGSVIEVTIRYDEQATVHVSAKVLQTGQTAQTTIVRPENLLVSAISEGKNEDVSVITGAVTPAKPVFSPVKVEPLSSADNPVSVPVATGPKVVRPLSNSHDDLDSSEAPIPLCNDCGEPLDARGRCPACPPKPVRSTSSRSMATEAGPKTTKKPTGSPATASHTKSKPASGTKSPQAASKSKSDEPGREEFFRFTNEE
ncbi:Hsp70 family protein [bacterium]|nr:Hsp70 family protein [bacterium]